MLVSAKNLYHAHKANKGMSIPQWSVEKAEEVLKAWQREFTNVMPHYISILFHKCCIYKVRYVTLQQAEFLAFVLSGEPRHFTANFCVDSPRSLTNIFVVKHLMGICQYLCGMNGIGKINQRNRSATCVSNLL